MYRGKRLLALIPARGGSKGIKNKNVAPVCGKPLIAYTIEAALQAACFNDIVVSTDSELIASVALEYGASVPFMRPAHLSSDHAKGEGVVVHALETLAAAHKIYDLLVYLQPTSPLRRSKDILSCLDYFLDNNLPSLASVSPVQEHPLFMRTMDEHGKMQTVLPQRSDVRRQDLPPYYIVNGAIYINYTADVLTGFRGNDNKYGYVFDSTVGFDVNTPADLERVQRLLADNGSDYA